MSKPVMHSYYWSCTPNSNWTIDDSAVTCKKCLLKMIEDELANRDPYRAEDDLSDVMPRVL